MHVGVSPTGGLTWWVPYEVGGEMKANGYESKEGDVMEIFRVEVDIPVRENPLLLARVEKA